MARVTARVYAPRGHLFDPAAAAHTLEHASEHIQVEVAPGQRVTGKLVDASVANDGTYMLVTVETEEA